MKNIKILTGLGSRNGAGTGTGSGTDQVCVVDYRGCLVRSPELNSQLQNVLNQFEQVTIFFHPSLMSLLGIKSVQ